MRFHDSLIAAIFLILGIFVVIEAQSLSPAPGQPIGPALFPTIAGIILAGSSVGLIIRSLRASDRAPFVQISEHLRRPRNILSLFLTLISVVFYIWTSAALGFMLCSFIILAVLLIAYGTRPLIALTVAVALPIVLHLMFAYVLSVPLPTGFLEKVI